VIAEAIPRLRGQGLAGRHALVVGAGRGLGRACALGLVQAGARVSLVARSEGEIEHVADEARSIGGTAEALCADVTEPDTLEEAVQRAEGGAPIDILVNAAGINRPQPSVGMPVEDFDAVMATNLRGTFVACRAVARGMLADGRPGRIINMSSQMGSVGYPGRAAYCASKHGVDGLTRALAVEWARDGITVNAVAPTFIRTPMTEPMLAEEDFREDVLRRIPMGRVGEVDEVMGAVVFLASDAARLITGHVLAVDGGWVAW
jgi:NAD(P)-dependent dehydrogenase (short-subunit alcohol dehydrogenase family)